MAVPARHYAVDPGPGTSCAEGEALFRWVCLSPTDWATEWELHGEEVVLDVHVESSPTTRTTHRNPGPSICFCILGPFSGTGIHGRRPVRGATGGWVVIDSGRQVIASILFSWCRLIRADVRRSALSRRRLRRRATSVALTGTSFAQGEGGGGGGGLQYRREAEIRSAREGCACPGGGTGPLHRGHRATPRLRPADRKQRPDAARGGKKG